MIGFFTIILVALFVVSLILLIVKKKFETFDIYAIILFLLQMFGVLTEFADYYLDELFDLTFATVSSFAYCIGYFSTSIVAVAMLLHSLLRKRTKNTPKETMNN